MREKLVLVLGLILVLGITGCGNASKKTSTETPTKDAVVSEIETPTAGEVKEVTSDKKDIDYYVHIDTSKFDASKFNGDIFFFGKKYTAPITLKDLEANGLILNNYDIGVVEDSTIAPHESLEWRVTTSDDETFCDDSYFHNNTDAPIDIKDSLLGMSYMDNVEDFSFGSFGGAVMEEYTIEDVLKELGNPTSVNKDIYSIEEGGFQDSGIFTYEYLYDDCYLSFTFSDVFTVEDTDVLYSSMTFYMDRSYYDLQ